MGDGVVFQCADGYELVIADSSMALGSQSITITCTDRGTWSLEDINIHFIVHNINFAASNVAPPPHFSQDYIKFYFVAFN